MNVIQLNTDIYNSLGVLSNDESYLEKAARYLKKLAQAKRDVENAKAKEEALASINQAFTEFANSTSKCKITKCFCKSTPLVLRNSISFLVSH